MKNIIKITLILLLASSIYSCSDSLEEVNIDPNTFPSAGDAQVLSSAIGFLGFVVEVDLNYSSSFVWSQYYTWGIGVSIGNDERFVAEPNDNNGFWARSYASCLADLKVIETTSSSSAYRGIAKVLRAYIYQSLVDHFGDIPYTNSLSGAIEDGSVLSPSYDDASAVVYPALITTLDEAITELGLAEAGDVGEDDFIYGGSASKWIKFANSLKLRILMRTSEVSGQGSAIQSLIENGTFIETIADMPTIPYSGQTGDQNPMFARAEYGVGMFYFASNACLNVLNSLNDPRAEVLYTKATTGSFAGQIHGIDQGTIDDEPFTAPDTDYSLASEYAYSDTNPVLLMSPWEVWFLRAEADARYNTSDDETAAFNSAISTNFTYMGLASEITDYTTSLAYSSAATLNTRLNTIGVQKWISLNGTQEDEGWIEARRFDRPGNRIFTDGIWQSPPLSVLNSGAFPASWLYPESERSLNPNALPQRVITDAIFWDN